MGGGEGNSVVTLLLTLLGEKTGVGKKGLGQEGGTQLLVNFPDGNETTDMA